MKRIGKITAMVVALAFVCSVGLAGRKGGGGGGGGGVPATPVAYSIIYLDTVGTANYTAFGINNNLDVVGVSDVGTAYVHAFYYEHASGSVFDLQEEFEQQGFIGPSGQPITFDDSTGTGCLIRFAYAVNDSGQIAGYAQNFDAGQFVQPAFGFRYTPPSVDENGQPVPSWLDNLGQFTPQAMNNGGDVAGCILAAYTSDGVRHAAVWTEADGLDDLGLANGAEARAVDINESRQICGDFSGFAWRYNYPDGPFEDLGTLFPRAKRSNDFSTSINDFGDVAGNSQDESKPFQTIQHGFRDTAGQLLDLGTLGGNVSNAESINNYGDVVGVSMTAANELHVFLYSDAFGGMTDLELAVTNNTGGPLCAPNGTCHVLVNDYGEVCGTTDAGRAYILVPALPRSSW